MSATVSISKAPADDSPDWLFGPEVERAYQWFLESFRAAVAPIRRSLVDALLAGDIDPGAGIIQPGVRTVIRGYTNDLVVVFRDGTDRGAHAGREVAARKFPLDISFDLVPQRVLDEFEQFSEEAVDNSMRTMTRAVTDLIRGSQEEGLSIDAIAEEIDVMMGNRYVDSGSWKSRQIARTGTVASSNAGAHSAYRDADSVSEKTWLATDDSRTRHAHREADGQTVPIDGTFTVMGESLRYPGDPTGKLKNIINCRCTVLPGGM